MKMTLLVLVLVFAMPFSAKAESGPFGLDWGKTPNELRRQGVNLNSQESDGRFEVFSAQNLPKNLSIAEKYFLVFDKDYNLQKIIMISKDIDGDIYGSKGKKIYSEIKENLTGKYGPPSTNVERVGLELYDESDEFYQCLKYEGCGYWASLFEEKRGQTNVLIELKGLKRGVGFIRLTYEGPKWTSASDANKEKVSKNDADAL